MKTYLATITTKETGNNVDKLKVLENEMENETVILKLTLVRM